MKTVVVTGASSGIGEATARVLIRRGVRVFGSVRQRDDGARLVRDLGERFVPLIFDVTDEPAVTEAAAIVARALDGGTLAGLVNNAGVAVPGPLLHLPVAEFRRQLEVNLVGQLIATQAFAPLLGADPSHQGPPGRIVMMSSIGGRNAQPFMGAYATSKFGLEGFSESLRRELMVHGIDVIIIAPGAIATPIWDKADALDPAAYAHTVYLPALTLAKQWIADGRRGLPAARIGEAVYTALTARKPKFRYTVTPAPFQFFIVRRLPKRTVDRIIAKRLGWPRR